MWEICFGNIAVSRENAATEVILVGVSRLQIRSRTTTGYLITRRIVSFCVCYLHMQMKTLCRAVEISIITPYTTSVKMFYRGLTKVFIASPFCDKVHEGQVKRNHLS